MFDVGVRDGMEKVALITMYENEIRAEDRAWKKRKKDYGGDEGARKSYKRSGRIGGGILGGLVGGATGAMTSRNVPEAVLRGLGGAALGGAAGVGLGHVSGAAEASRHARLSDTLDSMSPKKRDEHIRRMARDRMIGDAIRILI